jgi:hypothetical protein
MNKFSTPSLSVENRRTAGPKVKTIEFLRQFARVYRPANVVSISSAPGFVLN